MINRPFSSINTQICDETTRNTSPANMWGQNVLVSQEQNQKVFNTLTTSIAGMPSSIPGMLQCHPKAVTFTFNSQPQACSYCPPCYCPPPTPAYRCMDQLQVQNAWDLAQLQAQLGTCYSSKFHLDGQTSTTDLLALKVERPDLRNLAGILKTKWPYWLQTPINPNQKKLILKTVTEKVEGHIYDDLDQNGSQETYIVCTKNDAECQAQMCCPFCADGKEEVVKKTTKKKKKKKIVQYEDFTEDDDDSTEQR